MLMRFFVVSCAAKEGDRLDRTGAPIDGLAICAMRYTGLAICAMR
jgi:NO-binding membrane sensor protein with MHYT domain